MRYGIIIFLFLINAHAERFEGFIRQKGKDFYLDQKNSGGFKNILLNSKQDIFLNKYKDIYVSFDGQKSKCVKTITCINVDKDLKAVVYNPLSINQ